LLTARGLLLDKLRDTELSLRGIPRGFGLKLGKVTQSGVQARVRELVANHPMLQQITGSMLLARATLQRAQHAPQGASQDRTPRQSLPPIYDRTRCRSDCGDHVQDGGRQSAPDQEIEGGRTTIWINP
jgi:hypothetical protein